MLIQLERIRDEPLRWHESLELDPKSFDRPELVSLAAVEWNGSISFADPGYYLKGTLSYRQRLTCDRCLGEVEEEREEPLELLILAHPEAPEAEEQELQEHDMSVVHVSGDEFDTTPVFTEQVQLNIPMKPLCRPDCAGLCPQCGADRNLEPCDCQQRIIDPRWAALAALRGESSDR